MTVAPAIAQNSDPVPAIEKAVNGFFVPAYGNFSEQTTALHGTIEQLCTEPSDQQVTTARQGFRDVVEAWSAVSIARIGPIMEQNRLERLLFWPDRRGIGLRQVQALIAKQDPSATNPEDLSKKSVAVQGLAALEFVLFAEGSETLAQIPGGFRCRFALAISANVESIASDLFLEWQAPDGFADKWQRPDPDNALYRNEKESLSALTSLFANQLEYFEAVEIGAFLGVTPDKDNPRRALFRRSDSTLMSLRTGFDAFRDLYNQSHLPDLLAGEHKWIDDAIVFGFRHGGASLDSLSGSAAAIVEDPDARAKLAYVRTVVRGLGGNFGIDMTAALGLTSNFSSLDGD
ncbi:imelysin family protein [Hoeflea sp.]|uniref:imelysin family protein n=1 Tax=Hoeflea sp. TaxID=1940281 RepID=UPI003B01BC5D